MIKSPEEVKKIEASQEITDAAFQHILPYIKEGVTERDLALEIEFFMRKQGAENVAFELIVAAGKNGIPVATPSPLTTRCTRAISSLWIPAPCWMATTPT